MIKIYFSYLFGLCDDSWLIAPKTLRISCAKSYKGVFSYVNEVTVELQLSVPILEHQGGERT